jgi:hypothetical protein
MYLCFSGRTILGHVYEEAFGGKTFYCGSGKIQKIVAVCPSGEDLSLTPDNLMHLSFYVQADGHEAERACALSGKPYLGSPAVQYFFGDDARRIVANWF